MQHHCSITPTKPSQTSCNSSQHLQSPGKVTEMSPKLLCTAASCIPLQEEYCSCELKGRPELLVPNEEADTQSPVTGQAQGWWAETNLGVVKRRELRHMAWQRGMLSHHAAFEAPCKATQMLLQTQTSICLKSLG